MSGALHGSNRSDTSIRAEAAIRAKAAIRAATRVQTDAPNRSDTSIRTVAVGRLEPGPRDQTQTPHDDLRRHESLWCLDSFQRLDSLRRPDNMQPGNISFRPPDSLRRLDSLWRLGSLRRLNSLWRLDSLRHQRHATHSRTHGVINESMPMRFMPLRRQADIDDVDTCRRDPAAELSARLGGRLLIALAILAAVGKPILYDTLDPDLFWHLRVAEQLRTDGIGPLVDQLSFASLRQSWTPYSWLAELIMERVWQLGGFRAVLLAQVLLVASLVGFIAAASVEATRTATDQPRHLAAAVATFAATFLSLPYLSFRPVLFALLLFAAALWIVWRDRRLESRSRAAWLLPPIVALCVNLHLYALVLATLLVVLVLLDRVRPLSARLMLCGSIVLASACTPMLPGVLAAAWHYQNDDPMVASGLIAEMLPFWRGTLGTASAVVASLALALVLRRGRSLRVAAWIALAMATVLLLRLGRFAPVFAIVVAPLLAGSMVGLSDRLLALPLVRGALACLALLGTIRLSLGFPSHESLDHFLNRYVPEQAGYPTDAASFVQANVPARRGRVINEFTWGGYLAWKLDGQFQTLLDGRTQLFPDHFWRALYLDAEPQRRSLLASIDADAAILPLRHSHFRETLRSLGWTVAYRDDVAEVLLPPDRSTGGNTLGDEQANAD